MERIATSVLRHAFGVIPLNAFMTVRTGSDLASYGGHGGGQRRAMRSS